VIIHFCKTYNYSFYARIWRWGE